MIEACDLVHQVHNSRKWLCYNNIKIGLSKDTARIDPLMETVIILLRQHKTKENQITFLVFAALINLYCLFRSADKSSQQLFLIKKIFVFL